MQSQKNIWLNNFKNQVFNIYFNGEFYNDYPLYRISFENNKDFISFRYEKNGWNIIEKNNPKSVIFTKIKNKNHPFLLPITTDWNLKNTLIEKKQIRYFNTVIAYYQKKFLSKFVFWNLNNKNYRTNHFIRNFIYSIKQFNLPEDIIIYILKFIFTSEMINFVKYK